MTVFPKFSKKREGVNEVMEQRLLKQVNNLILNTETCTGCGICSEACPEEAISIGPVGASRRGAIDYAAPIAVDETACSYCGVCVILCPFNALKLLVDGEERLPILEKEGFPTYDMVTTIDDEKCTRCTICEDVCPRDAINRDVPAFEGESDEGLERQLALTATTTFKVDDEKCTYCGICDVLCPAITVKRNPFTAETGDVTGEVLWDEDLCDACTVCVEACPEECITVEREISSDKMQGTVEILSDDCCTCRWCAVNCPPEAITVEKIFDGEITFYPEKCPGGCSTCVDICPANAIYLPSPASPAEMKGEREPNIAVNKDFCIFCGACVNACPGEDIIVLKRNKVRITGEETDLFKEIREKLFTERTSKVKEDVPPGEVELKIAEEKA
ncbi:MAG: 4Fe-4S binding protein [Methanomicrobiales archaeon]